MTVAKAKTDHIKDWPAAKVELMPLDRLVPYARNSRTHSDEQVAQIAASINEWGWTIPVLVDEAGTLIAGHGRIMAARKLGLKEVPAMTATGWTEAQKKAYVIADNKLALNAGWDLDALKVELADLGELGFDVGLTGFGDDELADLLAEETEGLTDPDDVPEPPADPVSAEGDVWVLGNHRIICGSSTDAHTVEKLLGPVKPHLMVTDPPYGVDYDPTWRDGVGAFGNTKMRGKVENDDKADWTDAWALFPGDVVYVWHGALHASTVAANLDSAGFKIRSQIIWVKQHFAMSRGDYHWMHEPCWYGVRKNANGHWSGDRKQTTIWQIDSLNPSGRKGDKGGADAKLVHGTQKPVECMKRPIENNSSPGQAVYEPFSGSGTTIIAGEMTGRHVYAIELNPAYVDVAVKRWQEFTGKDAVLEASGATFNQVAEDKTNANAAA